MYTLHEQMSEFNKMPASNLAIVFAPTILRPLVHDEINLLLECKAANNLIEKMILEYEDIFTKDAQTMPLKDVKGKFSLFYQQALEKYTTKASGPHTHRPMSSSSSKSTIVPKEASTPHSNQRKLLDRHWRLKRQTVVPSSLSEDVSASILSPRKGPVSQGSSELDYPESVQKVCRGCMVRYLLKNVSKKLQTQVNIAFRQIVLLQQNLVENLEELTVRYFPHFIAVVQRGELEIDSRFIQVAREIIKVNKDFLGEVRCKWARWPLIEDVGDILLQFFSKLQLLSKYHSLVVPFQESVREAARNSPEFAAWLDDASLSSKDNLSLAELIALPLQQISAYRVPLQQLLNASTNYEEWKMEHHIGIGVKRDSVYLTQVLLMLKGIELMARSQERAENIDHLRTLSRSIEGLDFSLDTATRQLVRKGMLTVNGKKRMVFLFSDVCIVARTETPATARWRKAQDKDGDNSNYRAILSFSLDHCSVDDVVATGSTASQAPKRLVLNTSSINLDLLFRSPDERVQWLTDLEITITKHRNRVFHTPLSVLLSRGQMSKSPSLESPPSPKEEEEGEDEKGKKLKQSMSSAESEGDASDSGRKRERRRRRRKAGSSLGPGVAIGIGKWRAEEVVPQRIGMLMEGLLGDGRENTAQLFRHCPDEYATESLRNALEVPNQKRKVPLKQLIQSRSPHEIVFVLRSFLEDLPTPLIVYSDEMVSKFFPWIDMYSSNGLSSDESRLSTLIDMEELESFKIHAKKAIAQERLVSTSRAHTKSFSSHPHRQSKNMNSKTNSAPMKKVPSENGKSIPIVKKDRKKKQSSKGAPALESSDPPDILSDSSLVVIPKGSSKKKREGKKANAVSDGDDVVFGTPPPNSELDLEPSGPSSVASGGSSQLSKGKAPRKQTAAAPPASSSSSLNSSSSSPAGSETTLLPQGGRAKKKTDLPMATGKSPHPLKTTSKIRNSLVMHLKEVKPSIVGIQKYILSMDPQAGRFLHCFCRFWAQFTSRSSVVTFHNVSSFFGLRYET